MLDPKDVGLNPGLLYLKKYERAYYVEGKHVMEIYGIVIPARIDHVFPVDGRLGCEDSVEVLSKLTLSCLRHYSVLYVCKSYI